jgi:hypothetical protein
VASDGEHSTAWLSVLAGKKRSNAMAKNKPHYQQYSLCYAYSITVLSPYLLMFKKDNIINKNKLY